MKKAAILLLLLGTAQYAFTQNKPAGMTYDYDKAWAEVADFEAKGLPESALKTVKAINKAARQEKDAAQLVKTVIHQLKFTDYTQEHAFSTNVAAVRAEAETAQFPVKPLLHSMLGEMYWQYYQSNRYRFRQRTQTAGQPDGDIETWSLEKIVQETAHQYTLSLADADRGKQTTINIYDAVLQNGNAKGRALRPTLYDFLAHRALQFFSGEEPSINQPAYAFTLDREEYLSDAKTFAALTLQTRDSLSLKFHALTIVQDLIRFHLQDSDLGALATVDLWRLAFIKDHSTLPAKNQLYVRALEQLERASLGSPVSTQVTQARAETLIAEAAGYDPLRSDAHKLDLRQAHELCEQAIRRFPDSEGAHQCRYLQRNITARELSSTIEEANVPGAPFRALIRYRNFTALHYRIIKITREEVRSLRRRLENEDTEEKFLQHFAAKTAVASGKFTLPDDGDYQKHSVEVKLDALTAGEYMVIFSHSPDFKTSGNGLAYGFTVISDISFVHRPVKDGGTEFYVLHRQSGQPLSGVQVEVYSYKYNHRSGTNDTPREGVFTTDAKGYFKVPFLKNENRRSFFVNFRHKSDFNSTEAIDRHQYYEQPIYQYKQPAHVARRQTHFFLDRSIYRPGQTIYFKGLVVSTDERTSDVVPKYSTTLTLYDVNNQPRGEVKVMTNDYGTFSGTFTAPATGLTGNMRIQNTDGSGDASFSVEEYKRPKFEASFDTLRGTYRLNDQVKVQGLARAYSGANIDGAAVRYRVVREARFPYWWWCRWGYYPASPQVEVTHGETTTDAEGRFDLVFQAMPDLTVDKASDPTFDYKVYADVTDINGETHSASTYISVGYKSLRVGVPVDDVDQDNMGQGSLELSVEATNLAGQPEASKGSIAIYALKAPGRTFRSRLWQQPDRHLYTREQYYDLFPFDLYDDENNSLKWERGQALFTTSFDTGIKKTFTVPGVDRWVPGKYVLEITATDKDGQAVKEVAYFTVYAASAKTIPVPQVQYIQEVKLKGEPGEKAVFALGTAEKKIHVLYEIERDGELLSKEWMTLSREQRMFSIPILETYRGNIAAHVTFVSNSRVYTQTMTIQVPYTNKELGITFESFRDKLQPGQQETWSLRVKGKTADKIAAEMVATLYDQSLDAFRPHGWYASFFNILSARLSWQTDYGFAQREFTEHTDGWDQGEVISFEVASFDELNWYGYNLYRYTFYRNAGVPAKVVRSPRYREEPSAAAAWDADLDGNAINFKTAKAEESKPPAPAAPVVAEDFTEVKARTNFNETAFFYPHLMTSEQGEVIIRFTIPEALTRWKMLGFAHTQDLESGMVANQLVTQKDLMVVPNQPRFFREGDAMTFAVKVSSLVDADLSGQAQVEFFDALTRKPLDELMKNKIKVHDFALKPRQSANLEWTIEIPEGLQAITYRVVAKSGAFSDGEEMTLPVVTNRMLVTETLPLPIRGRQTKTFRLEKLADNRSTTLRHQRYTLEFTPNPAWYAVQALPYLMEYPYDCVEQTFSRFYANSIAAHLAQGNPRIRQVFDTWKNIQPDALLSNLEKNQKLKSALLEETPWVLQAQDETQRKRMVGLLFDINRMADEQERALDKIVKAQTPSGGFTWFPGFPEDRYMTQHIVAGLGHLDALGVKAVRQDHRTWRMASEALQYLDRRIREDYDDLKAQAKRKQIKLEDKHIGYLQIHYLYTRSYFKDVEVDASVKEAFNYFLGQARQYWLAGNLYLEGMACLALHRYGEKTITAAMIRSFDERALHSDELGMYWKSDRGYYWYQAPIETQALMIEVYDEVGANKQAVEDLKAWLLKQKQTQDWKTTKATAEACYALLRRGTDLLASTAPVNIKVGNVVVDPARRQDAAAEAGTGYFKTAWQAGEITPAMGDIQVTKTDEGVAWGAVYWQYFEYLDKITPADTPLKLRKALFKQVDTDRGPVITPIGDNTPLQVGDLVKVRIELRTDRHMEYIHLKDMRAAGLEPVSTRSTHRYQDGLYYYESPRDLAMNFFMAYLPQGTYVFEYALRVSQKGNFSNGVTTIQSMYAPEFTAHSQGIRITVK